jgi:hypothetical protein
MAQQTIRSLLGVGNAMGLQFSQDMHTTPAYTHLPWPLVTSTVASVNVLSEIMLISPFKLPGIKFHIFNKFELARQFLNSNKLNGPIMENLPAQPTTVTS